MSELYRKVPSPASSLKIYWDIHVPRATDSMVKERHYRLYLLGSGLGLGFDFLSTRWDSRGDGASMGLTLESCWCIVGSVVGT